jgi:hypothetical protein
MEVRWFLARQACKEDVCDPAYAFHAAGCPRKVQKVKVTNLNTGVTSEATLVHSDVRAVKEVLDQHKKQAVRLEPEQTEWSRWERGLFEERNPEEEYRKTHASGWGSPDVSISYTDSRRNEKPEAPARPWWKFWGKA